MINTHEGKLIPGCDLYYRLLRLDETNKQAIILIHAIFEKLIDIPYRCQEISVAMEKLNWWQSEIDIWYEDQPRHPLTQQLNQLAQAKHLPKQLWTGIIDGILLQLNQLHIAKFNDLVLFTHHRHSLCEMLCCYSLTKQPDKSLLSLARDCGSIIGLISLLQDFSLHLHKGLVIIPQTLTDKYKIPLNSPKEVLQHLELSQALKDFITTIKNYIIDVMQKHQQKKTAITGYFFIGMNIANSLLKKINKQQKFILNKRIVISPLRKYFNSF
ncbi:MAG: squalene/phytoene synthase family protein [Pseudomonadota bacterium]